LPERAHAGREELEVPLALPASLRRRGADAGSDEPLALEAIEGRIDGADRRRASAAALDLGADRGAVAVTPEAQQRQQDEPLEFADVFGGPCELRGLAERKDGSV
jgi:hypothetical protein